MAYVLIGIILVTAIIYLTSRKNKALVLADNTQVQEDSTTKKSNSSENPYNGLRELAFNMPQEKVSVSYMK